MSFILPIIPTDLHQFESYERVIESLDTLEKVFKHSVEAICSRIQDCETRVDNISGKLTSAQSVLSKVEGTSKALTIESATEFPKVATRDDQLIPNQLPPPKYHPTVHEASNPGAPPRGSIDDVNLLCASYKANRVPAASFLDVSQSHQEMFLGPAPQHLSHITSLLLFNTEENPYQILEAEVNHERPSELVPNRTGSLLPEPPSMLGRFDDIGTAKKENMFVPTTSETPVMNMPMQLNIPGIASLGMEGDEDDLDDDLGFNFLPSQKLGAPGQSTGLPSLPRTQEMPQLPRTQELPELPKTQELPQIPNAAPQQPQAVQQVAPPPPPPPPMPMSQPAGQSSQAVSSPPPPPPPPPMPMSNPAPRTNPTPPPPPPPPMPTAGRTGHTPPPPPKDVQIPQAADPAARLKLLSDIRTENPMARLKKVQTRETPNFAVQKKNEVAVPASANRQDAFQQLKAQIARRFDEIHAPAVVSKPKTSVQEKYKNESDEDWSDSD